MTAAAERPSAPRVRVEGIPTELQALDQWLVWSYEWIGDKWTKVPYRDRGRKAATDNPATWHPFATAIELYRMHGFDGIGFVFTANDPFCGVDIDHCYEGEALSIKARTIIEEIDSWAERTPSGNGIHIICKAALPEGKGRKNVKHGIEMYDRGRFFTVTGAELPGGVKGVEERQEEIDALHARLFSPTEPQANEGRRGPTGVPSDDQIVLDKARAARNGGSFARLWSGDTSAHDGDDSSADLALCNHLAFWCGPDEGRIDRLFRASGLYRTKWERASYRNATIAKALAGRADFYDWDALRGVVALLGSTREPEDTETDAPLPSSDPNDYPPTDTGNSRLFAAIYGEELRHDHRRGIWLRWRGHWWGQDDNGYARRLTATIAARREQAAREIEDERDRKAAQRWAFQSQSKAKRDALLAQVADEHPLTTNGADWDDDPYLLGVINGVLDLRSGTLHDGRPNDRVTMHTPIAFDPTAVAPRWERFITEVFRGDDDLIAWMQRVVGYCLTGDIGEHMALFCYGSGSNGKSTLLNILGHLLGDYAATTSFATLERADRGDGSTVELAALAGKRLVTASETNEGKQLNEARLKALTGGDPITARFLYQNPFTYRPVLKLWLAVNHKPVVGDDSTGFWRRVRLIPFLARFEGQAADKNLEQTLKDEAAGILAWAVRGCLAWQRDGLGTPKAVEAATNEYREESDPLAAFLAQCCTVNSQMVVRANALYHAYDSWAGEQGQREKERLSSTAFGRRIGERHQKLRDGAGNYYKGIAIAQEWTDRER